MRIIYSRQFAREYTKLPSDIKNRAEEKEKLFRNNPFHPQLKTHKLQGKLSTFWAFSLDQRYRIIFEFLGDNIVAFYGIGDHSLYEKF